MRSALLVMVFWATPAWAQSSILEPGETVDGQAFEPAFTGDFFVVEGARPAPQYLDGRVLFHYARNVLRTPADEEGDREGLVRDLFGVDVMGSMSAGPLRGGVALPVVLGATNDAGDTRTGIGDLRLDARVTVMGREQSVGGLAVRVGVRLPTSTLAPYLASGAPVGDFSFAGDRTVGMVLLAGSLGVRLGPSVVVGDVDFGTALTARLGASIRPDDRQGATAELLMRAYVKGFSGASHLPTEAMLGYWRETRDGWVLRAGLAAGLTPAPDSPTIRVVLGIAKVPVAHPDPDADGFDATDRCPYESESVNGIRDADGCPEHPLVLERVPGAGDPDDGSAPAVAATPEEGLFDPDGDGFVDRQDFCPENTEDPDQFEDGDGCPEPDNDGDLVADEADACPVAAETKNGVEDRDGCPDALPEWLSDDDAVATVLFDSRSTKLNAQGRDLLTRVADAMTREARLRLRIDGHSDNVGTPEFNQDLSMRRAESVERWLVSRGVAADRLEIAGHGASEPAANGDTPEARALNRRVDLSYELEAP